VIGFAAVYDSLVENYGPQYWWPADDRFEIVIGALLVQRTSWESVEAAIDRLHQQGLLDARALEFASIAEVEACIRSTGFFRAKARRLIELARFVERSGGMAALQQQPTPELRRILLGLDGIGEETADAILLYAFDRPVVVVDEYLRRLVRRMTAAGPFSDRELRESVAHHLADDVYRLNELHALVVAHGKAFCRAVPRCAECAISHSCRTGSGGSDAQLGEGVSDLAHDA
jgi:endonuclease-3 related protein